MDIGEISLITSLWIIIIFGLIFFSLLWFMVTKRRTILKSGLADEEILRNIRKKYRKFFYDRWQISKNNASIHIYALSNARTLIRAKNTAGEVDESQSLVEVLSKKDGNLTSWSKLGVGICGTLIGICALLATTGVFYNVTGAPIRINKREYRLIRNDDIGDSLKGVAIRKNSLAGFEREDFSNVQVGEIIAFYDEPKENVYIKRVLSITPEGNVMCQGDYSSAPMSYDMNITPDRYVGSYSGYSDYVTGITVGFIKSNFGIIALYFMGVAIYVCTYCFTQIDYIYQQREFELAQGVDKQNEKVYREEISRMNNRMR